MSSERPVFENCPGIKLREHARGWEARWIPRQDLIRRGYPGKPVRLWAGTVPTDDDRRYISGSCNSFQAGMLEWSRGPAAQMVAAPGTLRALFNAYQTDPDSTYHKLRYKTREHYDIVFQLLAKELGDVQLGAGYDDQGHPTEGIKARVLHRWHEEWTSKRGVPMAHRLMTMIRIAVRFGAIYLEDPECERLSGILHGLKFKVGRPRDRHLTSEHVLMIRAGAHARVVPVPSIALAQAIQFECTLRQMDVIGEWVPIAEAGPLSDVTADGMKWIRGIRWSEIDNTLILRHMTSKRQKMVEIDLRLAPMVLEEFTKQFGFDGTRESLPASGPVVVSEKTGLPYDPNLFRYLWREIATAGGIPKEVRNMDSRAGAITEATDSGASLEMTRHAAAHSNVAQTANYSRGGAQKTAEVMKLRVEHRNKK